MPGQINQAYEADDDQFDQALITGQIGWKSIEMMPNLTRHHLNGFPPNLTRHHLNGFPPNLTRHHLNGFPPNLARHHLNEK